MMFQPGSRKEAVGFSISKSTAKKRAPAMMGICARAKLSSKLRASLRLALKGRDLTVAMPKFYVLTIDELPGVFFRGLVVGAYKPDCAADMTVLVKDVHSIIGHLRHIPLEYVEHRKSLSVYSVPDSKPDSPFGPWTPGIPRPLKLTPT